MMTLCYFVVIQEACFIEFFVILPCVAIVLQLCYCRVVPRDLSRLLSMKQQENEKCDIQTSVRLTRKFDAIFMMIYPLLFYS